MKYQHIFGCDILIYLKFLSAESMKARRLMNLGRHTIMDICGVIRRYINMGGYFWSRRFNFDKFLIGIIAIALTFVICRIYLPMQLHCVELGDCSWRLVDGQDSVVILANGEELIGPGDILLGRSGDRLYGCCTFPDDRMEFFVYDSASGKCERFTDEVQGVLAFKDKGLKLDDCVAFFALRAAPNRKELLDRLYKSVDRAPQGDAN